MHTAAYNHTIGTQKTASVTIANPWEDFHVYAMEWYADHIDVFVDGQKYFTFRNEGTGSRAWPFDKPRVCPHPPALGGGGRGGGKRGSRSRSLPGNLVRNAELPGEWLLGRGF